MKNLIAALALFCVTLSGTAFAQYEVGVPGQEIGIPVECPAKVPEGVLRAVVKVGRDSENYASGWVYSDNRVTTAAHVANSTGKFAFMGFGDDNWSGILLGKNKNRDVAIYKTFTGNVIPLPFLEGDMIPQEKVWAVGFPASTSVPFVTEGRYMGPNTNMPDWVLKIYPSLSADNVFMTTALLYGGNSGGPLLVCRNGQFKVAGMNIAGYTNHVTFTVKAERVLSSINIIERLRDKPENKIGIIGP